jgi:hypothetical protein
MVGMRRVRGIGGFLGNRDHGTRDRGAGGIDDLPYNAATRGLRGHTQRTENNQKTQHKIAPPSAAQR